MKVAAIVLAAGASTRLGEPKQLARVGGERLLERALRSATEAGCDPVLAVLGAHAQEIATVCGLDPAAIVINPGWSDGMASSVRAGIAALRRDLNGVVLMTCDQPAVTAEHLLQLIAEGLRGDEMVGSGYAGRCGVPAFIPCSRLEELQRLRGDKGARDLLEGALTIPLDGGELDVDRPESLAAARLRFG